ncbi:AraC family transcriptional regulator ligand-binding domain-containing protein [Thalassotalea fusca]
MATIGHYYVEKAATAAKKKGINVDALIRIAGAEMGRSLSQQQRISDNAMTLYLNLLARETSDAFLGFADKPVPLDYFRVLLQSLYFCESLADVIESLKLTLALADCQLDIEKHDQLLTLSLHHSHQDPDHFILEYLLVLIHRLLSWLSGQQINAISGTVTYTPKGYRQEFSLLFRCPMTFNSQQNSLVFSSDMLKLNVIRQREEFHKVIKQFPLIVMRYPGEEQLLDRQIHQLLSEHFNQHKQLLTATDVAFMLDMSTATLRRKLASLLTSFAQIKAELRQSLSIKLLAQTTASVEEIAFHLSYSDARSFSRAFKQWTNMTPSAYRQYSTK